MKIFLVTNYSSQFLSLELLKFGHNVTITDYQELEALRFNKPLLAKALECDCVLFHFTSAQLVVDKLSGGTVVNTVGRISAVVNLLVDHLEYLPKVFVPMEDVSYFPNSLIKGDYSYNRAVLEVNSLFADLADKFSNITVTSASVLSRDINLKTFILSGCPYNWSFYGELAQKLVYPLKNINGSRLKGIILDLDNTCWAGVIGDSGLSGIRCKQDDGGEMFFLLQQMIVAAFEAGILLAISSKNEMVNVIEALKSEKVILSEEMFTHIQANWEPKDANIEIVVSDWNISEGDILFLDDNPTERSLVRRRFKDMIIPDWNNLEDAFSLIAEQNLFLSREITQDDKQRTKFFHAEKKRAILSTNSESYEDFLKGLKIKMIVTHIDESSLPRVEQLFQKTNQFNTCQRRFSRTELMNRMQGANTTTILCGVEDIYSNYGVVTAVALTSHKNELRIDNWVMSCRVFKKNIELEVLRVIAELALKKEVSKICVPFNLTDRNTIVQGFLENYLIFNSSLNQYEGKPKELVKIKTNVICKM